MMGHNIRFTGVIYQIIPKLSFLPLLIWSTEQYEALYDKMFKKASLTNTDYEQCVNTKSGSSFFC